MGDYNFDDIHLHFITFARFPLLCRLGINSVYSDK
jgi:hypothetical protein